ncbi:MBOAT family O-acyltransferase [Deltaproteobacteria bacterium IMCC39524]|nr:MBOAT family O-acyltransferase [Deltaproteobacteria bacterium IMCC39524]
MLFQTPIFFVFFTLFLGAYFLTRKQLRLQNVIILLGSYIFYGAWDERFLTLIIASTATDFLAGIGASGQLLTRKNLFKASGYLLVGSAISLAYTYKQSVDYYLCIIALCLLFWVVAFVAKQLDVTARKKFFVAFSVIVNLGVLAVFKYLNFFANSLQSAAGNFGYELNYVTLNIILPVGISFYTFQTLSYSIDIYRGKIKPTNSFLDLAAFVAFFPQLVAGPVERASNLLPQFEKLRVFTAERINSGATLFVWGLFKKVFIADNLSLIADKAFSNPGDLGSMDLLVGLLAFTFQIFCDFSGYSDMARGLARIIGFDLMLNFNIPYIARTPSEFWQRWHISLSSWLRDYLYIPLGGNKGGSFYIYRNLSLTMLLGGLWHGASWTFVIWGAYQGAILVVYRLLKIDEMLATLKGIPNVLTRNLINVAAISIMFLFTIYGWLIFRANTMDVLTSYTTNLLLFKGGIPFDGLLKILYYVWPLLAMQAIQVYRKNLEIFFDLPSFVRLNVALFVLYSIILLQPHATVAFIYFDF